MSDVKNPIKHSIPATSSATLYDARIIKKDTSNVNVNLSEEQSVVDMEASFRVRYTNELNSKKQQIYDSDRGFNELDDERRTVHQQMMRTPGRRGEIIKEEEISKEFSRRFSEASK